MAFYKLRKLTEPLFQKAADIGKTAADALTSDTSTLSQFLRPSTLAETRQELPTYKFAQKYLAPEPSQIRTIGNQQYGPLGEMKIGSGWVDPNFVGALEKAGSKAAGAFVRKSSPVVKNIVNKLNEALMDSRIKPVDKGEFMQLLTDLDVEEIPAKVIDRANQVIQRGLRNNQVIESRFTRGERGLFTGSTPKSLESQASKAKTLEELAKEFISKNPKATAEEFVKAQGEPVYHGTNNLQDILSGGFSSEKLGSATKAGSAKEAFFFAKNKGTSAEYLDVYDPMFGDWFVKPQNANEYIAGVRDIFQGANVSGQTIVPHRKAIPPALWEHYGNMVEDFLKAKTPKERLNIVKKYRSTNQDELIQDIYEYTRETADEIALQELKAEKKVSAETIFKKYADELEDYSSGTFDELSRPIDAFFRDIDETPELLRMMEWKSDFKPENVGILESYLDIKKPFIKEYKGDYRDEKFVDIIKKAKKEGYDSVIFRHVRDGGGYDDIYAVFESSQIKTRSQLTDIFNQAQASKAKTLDFIPQELRGGISELNKYKDYHDMLDKLGWNNRITPADVFKTEKELNAYYKLGKDLGVKTTDKYDGVGMFMIKEKLDALKASKTEIPWGLKVNPFPKSEVQDVVYHGTPENFTSFSDKIREKVGGLNTGTVDAGLAHWFTNSRSSAKYWGEYSGKKANIVEAKINLRNPLKVKGDEIGGQDSMANLIQEAIDAGHDGLIIDQGAGNTWYAVFNEKNIKTKSQLTDIWNKANKPRFQPKPKEPLFIKK